MARARTIAGCWLLSRGRVLVTDRLHGHILAVLAGQPHVVFDTANGKLRAFYDTWTRRSGAAWADSAEQAWRRAAELSRQGA
jgi:pyruvyl transferase EpsO